MEKKILNVKVTTIPNGYTLDVEKEKYMYHSLKDLLEGFMYHVGLGELGYTDTQSISEFITAAVVYRADDKKIAKKMKLLTDEKNRLQSTCDGHKRTIKRLKEILKKNNIGRYGSLKSDEDDDDMDEDE